MKGWRLAVLGAGASLVWSTGFAGSVTIPGIAGSLSVPVTSFQERRFDRIFQQEYDFSCGSAAVASLLTFHYDDEFSEREVFESMLALADAGKVRQEGFSMLDMKNFLGAEGYQADGIRLPLKGLREQVRLPTIVLLNLNGFRHFVVIKGINDKEVLVGDPARGVNAYSHQEFEESWDGTAFVIRNHLETGRRAFSTEEDWAQVTRAPLQEGLVEPPVGHTLPYWPSTQEW
ncbi:MAG: C39 family peptidase [Oleiphilaceae bacterium]|nr:C39 family peptidase [Oleiphilaceae bacterium]